MSELMDRLKEIEAERAALAKSLWDRIQALEAEADSLRKEAVDLGLAPPTAPRAPRQPVAMLVAEYLKGAPEASAEEIAERCGLKLASVRKAMKRKK